MMDSIPRGNPKVIETGANSFRRLIKKIHTTFLTLVLDKGWLFCAVGFLLGRAVILSAVSPFAVAFLATIWMMQRNQAFKVMIAITVGAFTFSLTQGVYALLSISLFILVAGIFKRIKNMQIGIPLFVLMASIAPRLFLHSIEGPLSSYEWMLLAVEGVLGIILVLIFMQSVPLLSPKRYKPAWKNEEIVCMIILLASILTGTIGWEIYSASVEQVLSRYFVMLLAFVGGAAIGSTVGVVAGLILSLANVVNLYQMSLLAFSGLMGGLLKEGNKIGVSIGLIVGTLLVGIYNGTSTLIPSLIESGFAIGLFLLTPSTWIKKLARFIPGTEEYTNEQEQYLLKVRDVTARRVGQFSEVFEALSKSFLTTENASQEKDVTTRETDYFLSQVTERTCQTCFMKERCWEKEFDKTYSLMDMLKGELIDRNEPSRNSMYQFENHCVKSKKVLDTMKEEMSYFEANRKLKQQVVESKRLVADQLQGVSEVMEDFAKEILKEREYHEKQEIEIINSLKYQGIELEKLEIYRIEKGNVDIELTATFYNYHGEGEKIIAPVLSEILDEVIVVKQAEISPFPNGYSYLVFGSAKQYTIETGLASAARGGGIISGDSYTTMEIGAGTYAMAISDGMGNGERAHEESRETLRLLQQILQTGIPEEVAIKSINSILSLRTTDEMFATLDLAMMNLHNAHVRFLKIGSSPSFIKRGEDILTIQASNLPMGIIQEVDVDIVSDQLKSDDLLIMMSDGILEGPAHIENPETWIKKKLTQMKTTAPQEVADLILEEVIRTRSGLIADDMTVLVAKIEKHIPEWSPIPVLEDYA